MQQLIVGWPFPVGQIGVAQQPERGIGVAVGLELRDDIEMFAEVGRPRRADETRQGKNTQRLARGAAQDGDTGIAQETEPAQESVVAACDRAVVRAGHGLRQLGTPCNRRRAAMRTVVLTVAMRPEPVRVVVADMIFRMPPDSEAARVRDRNRRGVKVCRHREGIEDALQGIRVPALPAAAVVPQPEVVEGRGGAVAPGHADGARLPPYIAEPTASRTIW